MTKMSIVGTEWDVLKVEEWDGTPEKIGGKLETPVITCNPSVNVIEFKPDTIPAQNESPEKEPEAVKFKVALVNFADKVQEDELADTEVDEVASTDKKGEESESAGKVVQEVELSNMEVEEVYSADKEVGHVTLIDNELELDVFANEKNNVEDTEVRNTESSMNMKTFDSDLKIVAGFVSVENVNPDLVNYKSNSPPKEKMVDYSSRIGVNSTENTHFKLPTKPPLENTYASMPQPRLQGEQAEEAGYHFQQPQWSSKDSLSEQSFVPKSSPTFTINTLSPSEIPSELHPFLENYIPVQGEVLSIPGSNYMAVVPMGSAHYYTFSDGHYSLNRKNGPPQTTNKSDLNRPCQTSTKEPVISSHTSCTPQPQPPFLKLNSGGINSITVTSLEPALIGSHMVQPRRIAPVLPRTRSRLKTGPGGRGRGTRRRNYSYTFKRRSLDILPAVGSHESTLQSDNGIKLPEQLDDGEFEDFVHCSSVSDEAVMSKPNHSRLNREVESASFCVTEHDTEISSKEKIMQEIDDIKKEERPQASYKEMLPSSIKIEQNWMNFEKRKTLEKSSHSSSRFRKKQFECMVCNRKYNREDFFSKHIKKCMKLHRVAQNSNASSASYSKANAPQTWGQIKTTFNDPQNVDSNSNYILGSECQYQELPLNQTEEGVISQQLPVINQISAETQVRNIFTGDEPASDSILGTLNTGPVPILNLRELEAQSPQEAIQTQILGEVSPEEERLGEVGSEEEKFTEERHSDSWQEIMEIAEQQGIFIPSMEPVNMDQQLMDAVSSIM